MAPQFGSHTIIIADEIVEIDLSIQPLAIRCLETGPEDMVILNTDFLSR